jgi:predicted amidophosphoribosyltransferase
MTAFLRLLSDVVYPPLCPATGAETGVAGALSPEAWGDLSLLLSGPRCGRCGRQMPGVSAPDDALVCEVCQDRPRGWDRGAAAFRYEGTGRRLVMALKHGDRLDLVPMLAGWMLRAGGPLLERADLVVPVPMHWTRLLRRRHNQSAELARALCRLAGRRTAYAPHLLTRARATPAQKGRSLDQRTANLTGAIALTTT